MSDVGSNHGEGSGSNTDSFYSILPAANSDGSPTTPDDSRKILFKHSLAGTQREWSVDKEDDGLTVNERAKLIASRGGLTKVDPLIQSSQNLASTLGEPGTAPVPVPDSLPSDEPPMPSDYYIDLGDDQAHSDSDSTTSSDIRELVSENAPHRVEFVQHDGGYIDDDDMFDSQNNSLIGTTKEDTKMVGDANVQKNMTNSDTGVIMRAVQACLTPFADRVMLAMNRLESKLTRCEQDIASLHVKVDAVKTSQLKTGNDVTAVYADVSAIKAKIQYQPVSAAVVPPVGVHPVNTKPMLLADLSSIKMWVFNTFKTHNPDLDLLSTTLKVRPKWIQDSHKTMVPNVLDENKFIAFIVLLTLAKSEEFREKNQDLFSAFRKGLSKAMSPGAKCVEEILNFMLTPVESDELGARIIQKISTKPPAEPRNCETTQNILDRMRSFK